MNDETKQEINKRIEENNVELQNKKITKNHMKILNFRDV